MQSSLCDIDNIFRHFDLGNSYASPVIACLYTGASPQCAAPMPRDPLPALGLPLNENFPTELAKAISLNDAVHDGAVMFGRTSQNEHYRLQGWSFRLFPPKTETHFNNMGSAFNSCIAMSAVKGVDAVYLINRQGRFCFQNASSKRL
jgi:hypothetical protein